MLKNANIHEILKSHPDLDEFRTNINAAEAIQAEIKKILPQTMKNKIAIVLATPKKLTIYADSQTIGAKLRQKFPTILRTIQSMEAHKLIEAIDIKVAPTDKAAPNIKRDWVRHTQISLTSIEQMKAKLTKF